MPMKVVRYKSHPTKTKNAPFWVLFVLVAGAGFEPHDLRVMSPTSYQTAPPRDMKLVPEAGIEPVRVLPHGILSPGRLPIPPLRHDYLSATLK